MLPYLIATMLVLVFVFAAVMRIVDHADFRTFGDALWWAVATVTTVGYGDVVPKEPLGRAVASILMVCGFAFLSLVTGTIASALVTRFASEEPREELFAALARIEERLAKLEERAGP